MENKIKGKLHNLVEECDLFCSPISLRYKNDNDYKTLTGGIVSILLIILFLIVFYQKSMETLRLSNIISSTTIFEEVNPSLVNTTTKTFMFVIGFDGIDVRDRRYFDISLQRNYVINRAKNTSKVILQPCTVKPWSDLGPNFQGYYHSMNFSKWLCPREGEFFQLEGSYTSNVFRYFKLSISKCTGQDCHNSTEIQAFLAKNLFFKLNFYYSIYLLNPEQKQVATLKLEDTYYVQFTMDLGVSTNIYYSSFQATTDMSLTPLEQFVNQQGMEGSSVEMRPYQPKTDEYVRLYLRKARNKKVITRRFTKLDDLFSYIGGLFGIIFFMFAVPLKYYNVCCYELSLASGLFTMKKEIPDSSESKVADEKQTQEVDFLKNKVRRFNFITYLGYLPYFCTKKIGFCDVNWKFMQPYYDSIDVLRTQIDISSMLKKLVFLDRVSKTVLNEHQRDLLYVVQRQDIKDIKKELFKIKIHKDIKLRFSSINSPQQSGHPFTIRPDPKQVIKKKSSFHARQSHFKQALKNVRRSAIQDEVSRRILQRMDKTIQLELEKEGTHYERSSQSLRLDQNVADDSSVDNSQKSESVHPQQEQPEIMQPTNQPRMSMTARPQSNRASNLQTIMQVDAEEAGNLQDNRGRLDVQDYNESSKSIEEMKISRKRGWATER